MRDHQNKTDELSKNNDTRRQPGNGFLATTLKPREGVQIGNIEVRISGVYSNQVVLVVKAPREIKISRLDRID